MGGRRTRRSAVAARSTREACHALVLGLAALASPLAGAQEAAPVPVRGPGPDPVATPAPAPAPAPAPGPAEPARPPLPDIDPCLPLEAQAGVESEWLDRMEANLRLGGCRSAAWIDGLFGERADPAEYRDVSGNISPSVLWSEYDGFKSRMRFRIDLPLPQADGKLRAFVGRVDREEFVTERAEPSGALPRQFGATEDEQTLLGLGYGGLAGRTGFDASAGIRVSTPVDPYVKASYRFLWPIGTAGVLRLRPTAFWQQSEQFGATVRVDYDRDLAPHWYMRLTSSGTYSGQSLGLRGYANATLFHRLSDHQAMAFQVGADGETEADVRLREYGVRTTYRQNVWREWLVLELRASLTWPRELDDEPRKPSWGAGVGFEMVFGPGTFRGTD